MTARRTYPSVSDRETQYTWLCHIEELYGVSLGYGQLYTDPRSGRVYAGSEYVCQVGPDADPETATAWAETIAHRPRGGRGLEVSTIQRVPGTGSHQLVSETGRVLRDGTYGECERERRSH